MLLYTIQRTLLVIPTLVGITIISFAIMHLAPGDPVDLFLGGLAGSEGISTEKRSNEEKVREDLRRHLGLDKPVHVQYFSWLSKVVLFAQPLSDYEQGARRVDGLLTRMPRAVRKELSQLEGAERKTRFLEVIPHGDRGLVTASSFWVGGRLKLEGNYTYAGAGVLLGHAFERRFTTLDFGRSFKDQQPVISRIAKRLPITIEINIISLFIAYLIGIPLGIIQAMRQNTPVDRALTTGTFALWSAPTFWVALLLLIFLCNKEFFYLFPASGIQSLNASAEWGFWQLLTDHAHHMVMPVVASTYHSFATISRFMRTSMLENARLDYVRTAHAKGLAEKSVVLRHILRNSLIPIVTIMAGLLPAIIAGSVFIETVFTIPGMGFLAFQSLLARDYPIVMAIFTIGSTLSLLGILIADLLLRVVDPRIDFSKVSA